MSKFNVGDVVVHKTARTERFVVVSAELGKSMVDASIVTKGEHADYMGNKCDGIHRKVMQFLECELEPYVEPAKDVCSPCPYACENGEYGDDEQDDTEDPFEMDEDDRPDDDGEFDVMEFVGIDEMLEEAANRLEDAGFKKLAGAVDTIKEFYLKEKDSGRVDIN